MKKRKLINNDEIDLVDLIKTIWDHKLKVILFLLISIIIGIYYINKQPNLYKISLNIKPAKYSDFLKYIPLQTTVYENKFLFKGSAIKEYIINNETIFEQFLDELMDYEEIIFVLKNEVYIKNINELAKSEQKKELVNYAKRLDVIKSGKKEINYALQFMWHDANQGAKILDETLNFVLKNLKKNIIHDIKNLAEAIDINNSERIETLSAKLDLISILSKKKISQRIEYLKNQSEIAKTLGIEDDITKNNTRSSLPDSYYLRGYKAIDIEINLLQSHKKEKNIDLTDVDLNIYNHGPVQSNNMYVELLQQLDNHKNDLSAKRLIDRIELLENDNEANWINYDMAFAEISSMKTSSFKILVLSIIVGIALGVSYVLIYRVFKNQ